MESWNIGSSAPAHQGPIDDSVLYLQSQYRSVAIFNGIGVDLDVRRCDKKFFQSLRNLDPRMAHYVDHAGFRGVRMVV